MSITIVKKTQLQSVYALYKKKKPNKQFSQTKENLKLITLLKVYKNIKILQKSNLSYRHFRI